MPTTKRSVKHPKGTSHSLERSNKPPALPTVQTHNPTARPYSQSLNGGYFKTTNGTKNNVAAGRRILLPVAIGADASPTAANVQPTLKVRVVCRRIISVQFSDLLITSALLLTSELFFLGSGDADGDDSLQGPAMLDLLDLVRQRRKVQIKSETSFPNSVTITGSSQQMLCAAYRDISGFIHHLRLPGQNQVFMVQSSDDWQRKIYLTKDINQPKMVRLSSRKDSHDIRIESASPSSPLKEASFFRQRFAQCASLQTIPKGQHTQVHLGKFLVSEKDGNSTITTGATAADLQLALDGLTAENSTIFDRRIGSQAVFRAYRELVARNTDLFYPLSSLSKSIEDIQPQHFLVGVMESFRFELEIGPPGSAPDGSSARLSGLRVFQVRGSEEKLELTVVCPNHHVDWKLETTPELQPEDIPPVIKEYLQCLTVIHDQKFGEFPSPIVSSTWNKTHRVKQLYGKTAWTVGCKGTQYKLELGLYHKFSKPRPGLQSQYQALMGVSIWSSSWDELLKPLSTFGSCQSPGEDLNELFQPETLSGEGTDGVISFLKLMQQISSLWDEASDQGSPPVALPATDDCLDTRANREPSRGGLDAVIGNYNGSDVNLLSGEEVPTSVADVVGNQIEEDLIIFD